MEAETGIEPVYKGVLVNKFFADTTPNKAKAKAFDPMLNLNI